VGLGLSGARREVESGKLQTGLINNLSLCFEGVGGVQLCAPAAAANRGRGT
jgi:hypothetical protein